MSEVSKQEREALTASTDKAQKRFEESLFALMTDMGNKLYLMEQIKKDLQGIYVDTQKIIVDELQKRSVA